MNKQFIRERFKYYRQRINELQQQINDNYYYQEECSARIARQNRAYENERIERERQAESDRWYREEELRRATSDIERARSWGNEWEEDKAIQRLKRLNY